MDGRRCRWRALCWACPPEQVRGVVFITVNQVLVRLWARRGRKSDRMWSASRESVSWGTGPPAAVAVCSEASAVVHATGLDPVVLSEMILYQDRSRRRRLVCSLGSPATAY